MLEHPGISDLMAAVASLPRQFFEPLPTAVVRYWLEGKYAGGLAPSVSYEELGWALMVRGFYRYTVVVNSSFSHRGYAVIDLHEGDIQCRGIRVKSEEALWGAYKGYKHPLLWRSDVSAIRTTPGSRDARLTCALRLLPTDDWHGTLPIPESFEACWKTVGGAPNVPDSAMERMEEAIAIPYLASQFEKDWHQTKDSLKPGATGGHAAGDFSGFMVNIAVPSGGQPVEFEGEYSAFGNSQAHGKVKFARIDGFIV